MRGLVLLALAGCGAGRTEVDYRLEFGSDFSDAQIASIAFVHLVIEEAQGFDRTAPVPPHSLDGHEGRLVYVPSANATFVQANFTFLDGNQVEVGEAYHDRRNLVPGSAIEITLDVKAISPSAGDMAVGADLAGVDLAGADLTGADLATGYVSCSDLAIFCDTFEDDSSPAMLSARWGIDTSDGGDFVGLETDAGAAGTHHSMVLGYRAGTSSYQRPAAQALWGPTVAAPLSVRFWARATGTPPATGSELVSVYSAAMGNQASVWHDGAPGYGLEVSSDVSPFSAPGPALGSSFDCYQFDVGTTRAVLYKYRTPIGSTDYGVDGGLPFPTLNVNFLIDAVASGAFGFEVDEILVSQNPGPWCPQ